MKGIKLNGLNIAIIGGSFPCREILQLLLGDGLKDLNCKILAVADSFDKLEGMKYAEKHHLLTTNNYSDIFKLENLDLILKFTRDKYFNAILQKIDPPHVKIMDLDYSQAVALISELRIEQEKFKVKNKIKTGGMDTGGLEDLFDTYADRVSRIVDERISNFHDERLNLINMEKELSQIIHGSMIPTFIINEDHIITHWNRACEDLTGYKSFELVGTDKQWSPFRSSKRPTMADVIVGGMNEEEVQYYYGDKWKKSVLIKEAYEAEEFFPHLGENGKWIKFTGAPIKSEDGKIIGAIETLLDSTQDKKAQAELEIKNKKLAHLHDQYKILFNNNPNPIFIVDSQTNKILDANNRVKEDYGYSKEQLLDKPFFDIMNQLSMGHSYTPEMITEFKEHTKNGRTSKSLPWKEISIRTKNDKQIPVRYSTSFLHKKGKVVGSAFFFHDLTEIKKLEKELVQSERLAAVGQTISGLAHHIKNILIGLKGGSYVVDIGFKRNNIDKLKDGWQTIKNNINRTSDLVQNLLAYSKERKPEFKPCNPNEIVEDVVTLVKEYAKKKNVNIMFDTQFQITDVIMDPETIHRSLLNLVSNSVDACLDVEDADREMRIQLNAFYENKNMFCIEVCDNGAGMSKEEKENLFTPFYSTKGIKGTGLGLLVTGKLIEEHQGTIDVSSTLGEGTCFTLKIPFEPVKEKSG